MKEYRGLVQEHILKDYVVHAKEEQATEAPSQAVMRQAFAELEADTRALKFEGMTLKQGAEALVRGGAFLGHPEDVRDFAKELPFLIIEGVEKATDDELWEWDIDLLAEVICEMVGKKV